ncbi:MAG TPA: outer membrane protein assembly factor BamA [Desulfomonilia bacterium]|nr:outer membrane protein assembly factor BamA [Desulfomonilia bacterium]
MRSILLLITLVSVLLILTPAPGLCEANQNEKVEPFAYAAYEGMNVKAIRIEFKECPWCSRESENLARDLIYLSVEEAFTEKLYRQSANALILSRRFEEVIPEFERVEDGIRVTFLLKPYWEIRDIVIHNEYPLFNSDIIKAMSAYPGDSLLEDMLSEQESLIKELYRKEGYINPEASVMADRNLADGTVVLNVDIKPGSYYSLDSLKIKGNNAILDAEIKSRMNSWRSSFFIRESGRFRETEFTQDIKNITSLYWQRGYPECEIRQTINKNEKTGHVDAELAVIEGPRYELSFSGNKRFWSYTLKKDIPIFTTGNRKDRGIREGIKNIKDRYRADGYNFTEVEVIEEKETVKQKKIRRLDLHITEGPRTLVSSLGFSGNSAFDEEELKKDMQTGRNFFWSDKVFNPDILDEDLANIHALYIRKGYGDVSISPESTWNKAKTEVSILVKISEGVKTAVTSVRFDGLSSLSEKNALKAIQLRDGKPFVKDLIAADEITLSDIISEKGHPHVTVKGEAVLSKDKTQAFVTYQVNEGRKVTMGDIYYRGNFKTRTSVIRKELGIQPGQPFSLKSMLEGQRNIRDMAVFDSVQFKTFGIKEDRERVTLIIDMDEVKPYYIQAGTGYASDRGLYGNTKAGDRNLFGLNKDAWLGGEVSQIGYQGQLAVTQQRFFDIPITSTYALSYEKKEEFNQIFGTRVWTSSLNFLRVYKPHVTTSLGFRYEYRDQFLQDRSETIPPEDADSYKPRGLFVTTPFISYDTRDSFVRPREGFYSSYSVDISKGYLNSLDNFLKHFLNLRYYYTPFHRVTLAWLGRAGYIYTPDKRSQIPTDQLFYLGGTMDVRGYDENMLRFDATKNPVGGRTSIVGSMEARIDVTQEWETALFYDTGAVRRALVDAGSDMFKSSVGIGLRYVTPIGPMGLLYGYKLNRINGESPGRFHFSVGYTF